MTTNRKTYFSFEDAYTSEHTEQTMYAAYGNVVGVKESKKKLIAAALGVVAFATAFTPPAHTPKPVSERNQIACVADIIEQAEKETSPQLCETIDLYMHKPMWLPTHKHLTGGNDFDDEVSYNPIPLHEYKMAVQMGSIEKGLPPVFAGWEDELEDAVYHV